VSVPTTEWILEQRGAKNSVDPNVPYAYLLEEEASLDTEFSGNAGNIDRVATIFLTNRECPFRCTMCDLWKNTTDETVPVGAIPSQIDFALSHLGEASVVKLYNSGNFFDRRAIPRDDWEPIAARVAGFRRVVVETHPRMLDGVERFAEMIAPAKLEVAMGLETVHPEVLAKLNKQMSLEDFESAAARLVLANVSIRTFILLQPPWIETAVASEWAMKSIQFAFDTGIRCCSVVPTRTGNGAMEVLQSTGHFQLPNLQSMESVLASGISLGRGRVFLDTWDIDRFASCPACDSLRITQIEQMNRQQQALPTVMCSECSM